MKRRKVITRKDISEKLLDEAVYAVKRNDYSTLKQMITYLSDEDIEMLLWENPEQL